MTDNVVLFNGITKLDLPPEQILAKAQNAGLTDVVIVGYDSDGELFFASSKASGPEALWLLELAKHELMEISK